MIYKFHAKNTLILRIVLERLLSLGYVYGKDRRAKTMQEIEDSFYNYNALLNLSWDSTVGVINADEAPNRYDATINLESILDGTVPEYCKLIDLNNGWKAEFQSDDNIHFSNRNPGARVENMYPKTVEILYLECKKRGLL